MVTSRQHINKIPSLLEEACALPLEIQGSLPSALEGTFYQVGPGRFEIGGHVVSHLFDGFAMAAACTLSQGSVRYTNRYLASAYYQRALQTETIPPEGCASLQQHGAPHSSSDNTDLALCSWRGTLQALGDTSQVTVLDPVTLATVETGRDVHVRYHHMRTPHPVIDPATGERYDLLFCYTGPTGYRIMATDKNGKSTTLCSVPAAQPGYISAFGVTPNYVVVVEPPFTARPRSFSNRSYLSNFVWDAAQGTRLFIIHRRTGICKEILTTHPLFFFSIANVWEEGETIVLDLGAYPDPGILGSLSLDQGATPSPSFPAAQPTRLTIDLVHRHVTCIPFKCPTGTWFAVDPRRSMQRYLTLYISAPARQGELPSRLLRYNAIDNTTKAWAADHCLTGQPIMIPASASAPEGTGWLLCFALDTERRRSFLLILDAETMHETARAWLPHVLPPGLSTLFVPVEALP